MSSSQGFDFIQLVHGTRAREHAEVERTMALSQKTER